MKKIFFFLSAIALLGLTTACVEQQEVNPNFNPLTREVNANFVFNIATNNSPMTKQTETDVQASVSSSNLFRGIDNGHVFAFTLGNDGKIVTDPGTEIGKTYDLPTLVAAGGLSGTGTGEDTDKSRRILELSIPTGTNTFMVYGKAIKAEDNANRFGSIDFNVGTTLAGTSFSLKPRLTEAAALENVEKVITKVLTNIVMNPTSNNKHWYDFATFTAGGTTYQGGGVWTVENPASPLSEIVGANLAKFLNIKSGAVRAGSGQSIARQIGDMVVSIGAVAKATSTSTEEATAIAMAKAIIDEMDKYFTTGKGSNNDYSSVTHDSDDVKWRSASTVASASQASISGSLSDGQLKHFPTEFNLPMGAAQLLIATTVNAETKVPTVSFAYHSDDIKPFGGAVSNEGFKSSKIMYPAELCYFGNSPIRVSDSEHAKEDYPDGSGSNYSADGPKEWLNASSWTTDWSARGKHVLSSTRSIAMADNINYGTALMKATVGYNSDAVTNGLLDNRKALNGNAEENNKFVPVGTQTVGNLGSEMFYLTGILVGGQYKTVGWNYIAKAATSNATTGDSSTDNKDYIIFDEICDAVTDAGAVDVSKAKAVPHVNDGSTSSMSDANYTLVWDNYNPAGNQDPVYVALEFVNNTGQDFWGRDNVIRKGGFFYIVGKLSVSESTTSIEWPAAPDYYVIPPYNANGTSMEVSRVFVQDYMTVVNFQLNSTSLQKAYVTVPDLRSSQMSLGLSVDLQWRQGLTFTTVLGQTN